MKFLIHLFLLLIMSAPLLSQSESFNVMTFNIRYPNPDDGFNYWDNRKDLVVSMIQYHEADLIGVQEAFRRQLEELTTALPNYAWLGVARTDGSMKPDPDNEFSAIIYRKDRFEVLESNTFWLSKSPDKVGSKSWDAALPRIVTWAKFKDLSTDKVFYHFNTHFDHKGEKSRLASAKLLLRKVKETAEDKAVVITGDFNADEISVPYRTLINEQNPYHFKDAMNESELPHHGPLGTWTNSFQFPGVAGRRIDYIFIKNGVSVRKHAILSDSWSGRLPSDHLPVLAEIAIQ